MRINPFFMPILLIVALFGTVFVAQALGMWSTSGKTAVDMSQLTPADLKGWMTLEQVIDGLKISKKDVYAAGNIPADIPATTALKDLEKIVPGFETSILRDALTQRLSGASAASSTAVPAQTTPEAKTPVATPAAVAATTTHTGIGTGPTPLPSGQILPADQIKGRMTLKEVSDQCAVPLVQILAGLKLDPETDPDIAIKDLIAQGKMAEVADVQKVVAELQKK